MTSNPRLPGRRFLHSPGPTALPDAVLAAMQRQPMDLADPRVMATIVACETGLKRLLQTEAGHTMIYSSNGHGVWEAVIQNLLAPGAVALVPGTGPFSDAWAVQCEAMQRTAQRTPWIERQAVDAGAIEAALRADKERRIAAVFLVHTETATGVCNPIDAARAAIDAADHPALLVVDAVASLAAEPLAMDAQRIDVVIGASQKGLMLPPGIGFIGLNAAALALARANPTPRYYWDWDRRTGEQSYQKFCGTPPLTLMYGMEAGLQLLFDEGLDAVHARHRRLSAMVHAAVEAWSSEGALGLYCADPAARAVSVTAVQTAPGIDADAIRRVAREQFDVAMAGGLGPLAGQAFRIGHLGDINAPMLLGALAGIEAALTLLKVPYGRDGVAAAVDAIARATAETSAGPW